MTQKHLQSVMNAALRFINSVHGKNWKTPGTMHQLLFDSHVLPVRHRISYKVALLCFKCINNISPSYLSDLIQLKLPSSRYNLRINNDKFLLETLDKPRYLKMENAFSFSGPKIWNSIPSNIRSVNDVNIFKTMLKTHYFEQAFHDLR